jgi:hypothetical protein
MGRMDEVRKKAQEVNERLDEFASRASGPDVSYGSTPGYSDVDPEQDAQEAAEAEGVTLYRNTDGSHEAVDESKLPESSEDETDS